ncbi:unnamed protein product, partial [Rhizopus stolonifer]
MDEATALLVDIDVPTFKNDSMDVGPSVSTAPIMASSYKPLPERSYREYRCINLPSVDKITLL